jgi:hypothetical protein
MGMGLAITLLAEAAMAAINPAPAIELDGRAIHVADALATGGNWDPDGRFGKLEIAHFPPGVREIKLSRQAVAGLVRRRVPGLAPTPGEGSIIFRLVEPPSASRAGCKALAHPLFAGESVSKADLVAVACSSGEPIGRVHYDRQSGAAYAAERLEAGTYLGRLVPPDPPAVEPGAGLVLLSRVGPVQIERKVTALQAGREGKRVFVMNEDGETISVTYAGQEADD